MTTFTVTTSKHATLTANTVDTVNVRGNAVEVLNRSATATDMVWFTVDGTNPTVAGDNTYLATPGVPVQVPADYDGLANVKLISATATPYSVTAVG